MIKSVKAVLSLLVTSVLIAALVLPVAAADAPGKIDYVAFGDSIAAGVRGGVGSPGSETSSNKGYTDSIAAKLQDAGIMGWFNRDFCTSGMTAKLLAQNTAVLKDSTTDAAGNVKDAELATLDIGANDMFAPLYTYLASLKSMTDIDITKAKSILAAIITDLHSGTLGTDVQGNIETILDNILTANSAVKIYVMGYYNPLPTITALYGVDLNEPTTYFNTFIQKAIADEVAKHPGASITYVPTFDAMASSSTNLAVTDIHPTEAGYQTITAEFWKALAPLVSTYKADAIPSPSAVTVNSLPIPFDAYVINDSTYVRLRDVAMALSSTEKKFSVGWDSTTLSVSVAAKHTYVPVGDELIVPEGKTATTAYKSPCAFTFDGAVTPLTAYMINNGNYVKLRDLAKILDFALDYDAPTKAVRIDVTKGYTPPAA